MNTIPLSLYIHFPWCVRKCPYCDFNSHEADSPPVAEYVDALVTDLQFEAAAESRSHLSSIFIGGGTPSLVTAEAMAPLLDCINNHFDLSGTEITLEANPGTYDAGNFAGYHQLGITRLSLGAQSFSDQSLQALGRIHKAMEIELAYQGAREAGFQRINLDLMHGLPGQSADDALADLDRAISLAPEHISWYQLTIEPNTVFYKSPPALPADSVLETIHERGTRKLEAAGYNQYEVSAFCRPGEAALHNLNYWRFGDYMGIGAGAHGKLTRDGKILRTTRTRLPRDYLAGIASGNAASVTPVNDDALVLEYLMNSLRLVDGFSFDEFEERTGLARQSLGTFEDKALKHGFITGTGSGIKPTRRGHLFLNDLLLLAMP